MAIKRCKSSFAIHVGGAPRVVAAGTLVDASDPIVKGREEFFEDAETYVSEKASRVEQATAVPGERRSVTRPAAKKTAEKKPERPKADEKPAGSAQGQKSGGGDR